MSTLLCGIVEDFAPAAEDHGQSLVAEIDPQLKAAADPELLTQMVVNLVENAMRHSPAGCANFRAGRTVGGKIELAVSDTGPGIPPLERDKVLRPFYRLEASRTTEGNGLGLSLVAAIAKHHHAKLSLDDNAPGLRVAVVLPPRQSKVTNSQHCGNAHGNFARAEVRVPLRNSRLSNREVSDECSSCFARSIHRCLWVRSQPQAAEQTTYKVVDRIKVPDGAFDYATYEPASGVIYFPRADNTTVLDPKTGKVSELKNAVRGHIALPLPGTTLIILTQRQGNDPHRGYGKGHGGCRFCGWQES